MKRFLPLLAVASLAACAPEPPSSPAAAAARSAAAYEYTAKNCAGLVGGFDDTVSMRNQAQARYLAAKKLGATDALIKEQQRVVENTANSAIVWVGKPDTCRQLVAEAAWNAT